MSGHVDERVRVRAPRAGALAFVYKPFDGKELLSVIQEVVDRRSER